MHERTLTALFENRADAERAAEQLKASGFDKDVEIHEQGDADALGTDRADAGRGGFMDGLRRMFGGHEDVHAYGEGLRRGHYLLTARVDEQSETRAAEILEASSAVDFDRTTQGWRDEGWTGAQPLVAQTTAGAVEDTFASTTPVADEAFARKPVSAADFFEGPDSGARDRAARDFGIDEARREQGAVYGDPDPRRLGAAGVAEGRAIEGRAGDEQLIPVVEERLRVGKRDVSRGGVRVRTYVVETPVDEQIGLREEHVSLERRAVDRPATDADAAFQDRTIELTETAEEAVIAKEAFVREELLVRKETGERVENVHDTVRRTEVEVDDTTGAGRDDRNRPL